MINQLYDKTSKIAFSAYGDDFLRYFGEYKKIIRELGTEFYTLTGQHGRLDKLVLVEDDTLQNWEFEFKRLNKDSLKRFWRYNNDKSSQTGKILDSFVVSFANPDECDETIEIGRSIIFAPIIKYLQRMGLHKKLNIIEKKVNSNKKISTMDELTLIFVTLSCDDKNKEKVLKRVCKVLKEIDYINDYRRTVIDSLIAFQIENFVKSAKDKIELNKVVNMQVSVEELIVQAELEASYDQGFDEGKLEGKTESMDEIIRNMLSKSVDESIICEYVGCDISYINELKNNRIGSK